MASSDMDVETEGEEVEGVGGLGLVGVECFPLDDVETTVEEEEGFP